MDAAAGLEDAVVAGPVGAIDALAVQDTASAPFSAHLPAAKARSGSTLSEQPEDGDGSADGGERLREHCAGEPPSQTRFKT